VYQGRRIQTRNPIAIHRHTLLVPNQCDHLYSVEKKIYIGSDRCLRVGSRLCDTYLGDNHSATYLSQRS
jgi:hypothetical protein